MYYVYLFIYTVVQKMCFIFLINILKAFIHKYLFYFNFIYLFCSIYPQICITIMHIYFIYLNNYPCDFLAVIHLFNTTIVFFMVIRIFLYKNKAKMKNHN